MKNILMVIESVESASFMLEKAIRFSPDNITALCLFGSDAGFDTHSLPAEMYTANKKPISSSLVFIPSHTTADRISKVSDFLSKNSFDMTILHRPISGREKQDFSLIKAILHEAGNTSIFLCGDTHWKSTVKVLGTVDVSHTNSEHDKLNEKVIEAMASLQSHLNAELNILSVIPISRISKELDIIEPEEALAKDGDATKKELEALVRDIAKFENCAIHVTAGQAPAEIASVSRKLKASFVVMGNVDRTGIKGLIIGNTAEKILKRLSVDALIVRK